MVVAAKKLFTIIVVSFGVFIFVSAVPCSSYAQGETYVYTIPIGGNTSAPQMPVGDAILKFLNTSEWLKAINQYVKTPLKNAPAKSAELGQEQVVQINQDIAKETGVDIFKLFKFVGSALVAILENTASVLRRVLPMVP